MTSGLRRPLSSNDLVVMRRLHELGESTVLDIRAGCSLQQYQIQKSLDYISKDGRWCTVYRHVGGIPWQYKLTPMGLHVLGAHVDIGMQDYGLQEMMAAMDALTRKRLWT